MQKLYLFIFIVVSSHFVFSQPKAVHNLQFSSLAKRWDEAIPLGNGWLGVLIWQKENKLRLSLDRVDLWDDRPMPEIDKLKFSWVIKKVELNQYDSVQKIGDEPYEKNAAPTKIPAAAIEFDLEKLGTVVSNKLDIKNGLSTIRFDNGIVLNNYIHAVNEIGYFGFENLPTTDFEPMIAIPEYNSGKNNGAANSVAGQGLQNLGYKNGTIVKTTNTIRYHQPTWDGNYYEVLVQWFVLPQNKIIGQWTISNNKSAVLGTPNFALTEPTNWPTHTQWWNNYWLRSSISLPDTVLEKQYYLDMYKFACVARSNTPPISLQAIWTADNGNLPPWKGDFHHDLNTELSYWPGYTSNHLNLTNGFTNWLWKIRPENKKWTKQYFEVDGLNVPGVTTISGKPMGGWIQYAMSPTTALWLAQHFYWQWQYSMNKTFLKTRASVYFKEVETYINMLTNNKKTNGFAISSSPEYNDNNSNAWFKNYTNYDLALLHFFYKNAKVVGGSKEGLKNKKNTKPTFWQDNYPDYNTNETGLTIAPGQNLEESHRHHAQLMAIYPLQLLSVADSAQKNIINASLHWLQKKGTRQWCGYSFSWAACIYARAKEADSAISMLQKFTTNFCSINSFHLNGDQKGGQYSDFKYRPFTLEGNFAFAQGIHQLLLQTDNGIIEIFPAIPTQWKTVAFNTLRTEGAFLVSAKKEKGVVTLIKIIAEQGGLLKIKLPFKTWIIEGVKPSNFTIKDGVLTTNLKKRVTIIVKNGDE